MKVEKVHEDEMGSIHGILFKGKNSLPLDAEKKENTYRMKVDNLRETNKIACNREIKNWFEVIEYE